MEELEQNIRCRWDTCADKFSSELSMGLHVMGTHLNVLDFGHFMFKGRVGGGPLADAEKCGIVYPELKERNPWLTHDFKVNGKENQEDSVRTKRKTPNSYHRGFKGQRTPEESKMSIADIPDGVKMSNVARQLINRLRVPSIGHHRLFKTEHFCVFCQRNWLTPCPQRHEIEDQVLLAEWKRRFGHLTPSKKLLISQLKQMEQDYQKQEENSSESEPKEDSEEPNTDHPESPVTTVVKPEQEQELESRTPSTRSTYKMSNLCTQLIYRIHTHAPDFLPSDKIRFCLNCLRKYCQKDHSAPERRLEKTWKKYYETEKITVDGLIEQLENLKEKYLCMEGRKQ
uniref:C2H2-type domain-containing protein n=4 Tax=Caenorhabditis japonica TaxID=281687 RepID=A0A8R1DG71_CAEJA